MSDAEITRETEATKEQPGRNLSAWLRPTATFALGAALLAGAVCTPGATGTASSGSRVTELSGVPAETGCCGPK